MKYSKKIIKNYQFFWMKINKNIPPNPNPYGKIDYEVLKSLNDCNGILHLGAHRGTEAEVYNWFGKTLFGSKPFRKYLNILKII